MQINYTQVIPITFSTFIFTDCCLQLWSSQHLIQTKLIVSMIINTLIHICWEWSRGLLGCYWPIYFFVLSESSMFQSSKFDMSIIMWTEVRYRITSDRTAYNCSTHNIFLYTTVLHNMTLSTQTQRLIATSKWTKVAIQVYSDNFNFLHFYTPPSNDKVKNLFSRESD